MSERSPESLTHGHLLARNTLYNLIGQGAPIIAGLVALPLLFRFMGDSRYGVLLLIWTVIGYTGLFDLGLSRALTKLVAEHLGEGRSDRLGSTTWTGLVMATGVGVAGGLLLVVVLPPLVQLGLLNVPPSLEAETVAAFYLLAASVPFIVATAGLRGVLEAYQRFDLVNAARIPFGIYNFAAPLCVLPFSQSLVPVVGVLVGGRALATFVHAWLCLKVMPSLRWKMRFERGVVRALLHFGTWVSVTSGGATLVIYLERILIGVVLPVAAIGYYSTPYDLVTKVMIIPSALMSVLFPAFSTHLAQDPARAARLFDKGARLVFVMLFPVALGIITLAPEGLTLWMGEAFAVEATASLQWLMAGAFFSALSYLPATLLHSAGRPDITGKLVLVYFPLYLLAIWWLTPMLGIVGVAIAHAVRLVLEGFVLFLFARRYLPGQGASWRLLGGGAAVAMGAFVLAAVGPAYLWQKALLLAVALPAFGLIAWRLFLRPEEREEVADRLRAIRPGS